MCENCTSIENYVPYQKCPICDGSGGTYQDMNLVWKDCDVCNGKKIIPMHRLKSETNASHRGIKGGVSCEIKPDRCECGGQLVWDGITRLSNPPCFAHKCDKCGKVEYLPSVYNGNY